jgi:hypothetical protein
VYSLSGGPSELRCAVFIGNSILGGWDSSGCGDSSGETVQRMIIRFMSVDDINEINANIAVDP